jgi:hypothetical protein
MARTLGFPEAAIPGFCHTIAGGLERIIGHSLHWLFLKCLQAIAGAN